MTPADSPEGIHEAGTRDLLDAFTLGHPDDLALTTAIIAMAHSLGITVVAEGVEKEGQHDILRDRGCDLAQGFWLGHPLPVEGFMDLLRPEPMPA